MEASWVRRQLLVLVSLVFVASCGGETVDRSLSGEVRVEYVLDINPNVRLRCNTEGWAENCEYSELGADWLPLIERYIREKGFEGSACDGSAGRDPLNRYRFYAGDEIVIRSGTNEVIGVGSLSIGVQQVLRVDVVNVLASCALPFAVEIGEADFSTIEIDGREGGPWSALELEELGWFVKFS